MKQLILILIIATSCLALTPSEKKIVEHAKGQLDVAQKQLKQSMDYAAWADTEITNAWDYANQTRAEADKLTKDIKVAHDNEQRLANEVAKYKPFWDQGHKYWGLGAIGLGIGILLKHLFILGIILAVVGAALWFLVPAAIPFIRMILNFFGMIFRKIGDLFRKR